MNTVHASAMTTAGAARVATRAGVSKRGDTPANVAGTIHHATSTQRVQAPRMASPSSASETDIRIISVSDSEAFVESSEHGKFYRVTRQSCTCPHHLYRGLVCKHMEAAFPAPIHRCAYCGTERVPRAGDFCDGCAALYGSSNIAPVPIAESTPEDIAQAEAVKRETLDDLIRSHTFETQSTRLVSTFEW